MIRIIVIVLMFVAASFEVMAQTDLPIVAKPAAGGHHPLVLYITGDGGMKQFSTKVVAAFQQYNYPVVALNALKYFWTKKSPEQAATDVAGLIRQHQTQWGLGQEVILVGYSMGADVLPFIYNALPEGIRLKVIQLVFLSPSRFTDMEVHLSGMLGKSTNKGMSVPGEMNRISNVPLLLIFGAEEKDFNLAELTVHGYKQFVLPGGHDYDDDAPGVVGKILSVLPAH
jgi:type IV secretory pathway VirJ component